VFEGYHQVDFMTALKTWDAFNKKVKCIYRQGLYEFDIHTDWKDDFKVHGGMILEGLWFVEE